MCVGFVFIAYLLKQGWPVLHKQLSQIRWDLFLTSIVIALCGSVITSFYFHKLLEKFHGPLPSRLCINMYFFSQIAKYIPGKIWALIFQGLIGRGHVSGSTIILANVELTATQINNTLCTGLVLILYLQAHYALALLVLIITAAGCYMISVSCFIKKTSGRLLSILRKTKKYQHLDIHTLTCQHRFHTGWLMAFFVLFCAAAAVSHFAMLLSLFSFSTQTAMFYTALLTLSWIIGVITLISPAGMGVRELIFIVLAQVSSQQLDQQTLAAIAVVTRLWMIVYEMLGVSLLYLINKRFPFVLPSSSSS